MTEEEREILNQIDSTCKSIDDFLVNYGNCILLFDFTTVYHYKNSDEKRIKSIYTYKIKDYPNLLEEYFSSYGYSIPDSASSFKPHIYSVKNFKNIDILETQIETIYNPGIVKGVKEVPLDTWERYVEDHSLAGASWIFFKDFYFNKEIGERIEVGVYLLLKNPVPTWNNTPQNDLINNHLHLEVLKFLYDNSISYFSKEYLKEKMEKERIERERNFHVGMAHYIKNSMTGLASQEGEIIRFVNKQENSERIRLIAKTQTLIYYLINLVLQLRQKSDVSAIGRMEGLDLNDVEYSIPIYNLIQTAYIHTILSKNKIQTFIDEWNNEDLAKAEKGIQSIEVDLNEIKDSFQHNKTNDKGLFKRWDENFIYNAFKAKYDHSFFCIDLPQDIQYSMTLKQCKSIYAAFLEIFDNIYGVKHNMNNASIKLDDGKIKIVAYNSKSKDINWKDDFTDLVCEAKTNGMGLRIIKAAVEDCNYKFSFTNGEAKEYDIDDRTIRTYCYQIEKQN